MLLPDLLKDMGILEGKLWSFEEKFGVRSEDFYQAMTRGERVNLPFLIAEIEQSLS